MHGFKRNPFRILVRKPDGKVIVMQRWEDGDDIKVVVQEIGWVGADWCGQGSGRNGGLLCTR